MNNLTQGYCATHYIARGSYKEGTQDCQKKKKYVKTIPKNKKESQYSALPIKNGMKK